MTFRFTPSAGWNDREHRLIAFGEALGGAVEFGAEAAGNVAETSAESFCSTPETLNGFAGGWVDSGVNTASSASDTLNGGINSTLGFCGQFGDLGGMAESAAGGLGDMVKGGGETLASGVESGAGALGDAAKDIGDGFGPIGSLGGSMAKGTIESGGSVLAGGIRSGADTMGNTISDVPATLGQMAGGLGLPDIVGSPGKSGGNLPGGIDGCWKGAEATKDNEELFDTTDPPEPTDGGAKATPEPDDKGPAPAENMPAEAPKAAPGNAPTEAPGSKPIENLPDRPPVAEPKANEANAQRQPPEQTNDAAQELQKKSEEEGLSTWQKTKIEKYHDWVMSGKDKADLDRAAAADDAINGNDEALQEFIRQDQFKSGTLSRMGKKTYQWASPDKYNAVAREHVKTEYEKQMTATASAKGVTRQELDYMVDYHRSTRKR